MSESVDNKVERKGGKKGDREEVRSVGNDKWQMAVTDEWWL